MIPAYAWDRNDVMAIKATWQTEEGKRALTAIIDRLGMLHGDSFDDMPLRMAHTEGRRFVARALAHAINTPIDQLVKEPDDRSSQPVTLTQRATEHAAAVAASLASGKPIPKRRR